MKRPSEARAYAYGLVLISVVGLAAIGYLSATTYRPPGCAITVAEFRVIVAMFAACELLKPFARLFSPKPPPSPAAAEFQVTISCSREQLAAATQKVAARRSTPTERGDLQ